MAGGVGSLSSVPLKCEDSAFSELGSQPKYKIANLFAPANSLELAIKLFCDALWIALIVFFHILVLPCLKNIGHSWPVKHLRKKKNHSKRGGRRTIAGISLSFPFVALPSSPAHTVLDKDRGNRQKWSSECELGNDNKKISVHRHPSRLAKLHEGIEGDAKQPKLPCKAKSISQRFNRAGWEAAFGRMREGQERRAYGPDICRPSATADSMGRSPRKTEGWVELPTRLRRHRNYHAGPAAEQEPSRLQLLQPEPIPADASLESSSDPS